MTIFKQWEQVLDESKTMTRRLNFHPKVGSIQAVVPKYLHPSVWWHPVTGEKVGSAYDKANELWGMRPGFVHDIKTVNRLLTDAGFKQGKVLIVAKRSEPLQDITEADAIAEGVSRDPASNGWIVGHDTRLFVRESPIECYAALWDSINPSRKLCWDANPVIVAVTFKLVKAGAGPRGEGR